jgi:hypothetical protein
VQALEQARTDFTCQLQDSVYNPSWWGGGGCRMKYLGRNTQVVLRIAYNAQFPSITSLNSVNQLIVVMVKCGVLFEVRTEFLNNI